MEKIKFVGIDYDYFDFKGRNYARIVGRDSDGKKVCLIDSCDIYFWAILKDGISSGKIDKVIEKIEKIKVSGKVRDSWVLKAELFDKKFLGRDVKAIKIYVSNYKDAHDIASEINYKEIFKRREYDLSYVTKYLIEREMKPLKWYEVEGEVLNNSLDFGGVDNVLEVDICLKVEGIKKLNDGERPREYKPKILAYDIETDGFEIGKEKITMISLVGEDYKRVLSWKKSKKSYVETFKDEEGMIDGFISSVKKYDPDILVGYYSDGFDLPYLRARAEKNKIRLNLGVDGSQPSFSRGRVMTARIKGIVHVDLLRFIRTIYSQYLQSETLSLNDVAFELLGERKNEWEFKHSSKMKAEEWEEFFEYNLKDSVLTYKLMEKMLPDMLEFCKIIGEPIFDVSRDSMSAQVENYLIHNMEKYNEIIEKRPYNDEIGKRRANEKYEGAFVFQPIPGLYENIVFFDFTSMYGSIIVSYNLSRSTFIEKKEKNSLMVDIGKKVYFSKDKGFFSEIVEEMICKRKEYKKEYNENPDPILKARSNAFKLLVNAAYGYQGFFGARYYCIEAAAATAALARKSIKETISIIEKQGHKIIYSDSVNGNTMIFIKKNGIIYEKKIKNLFERTDNKSTFGKEYNYKENLKVLTLDEKGYSVFKPIVHVMRHKCNKKMYRINFTNNWNIDVTEDHSLIGYQSVKFNQTNHAKENPLHRIIEIKPEEIKKKANSIITLMKIPNDNEKSRNYPKNLYELMGFFIGDGSFHRNKLHQKYNKDYYLGLSLGLDKDEIFEKLIKPLIKSDNIKNYWWSNTRIGDIRFNGLKLVKFIAENCRDENNKKIIPKWLFDEKEENINSFLRGLFSADGTVMLRHNAPIIKFTSINDDFIKEVRKLLYRVGISHSTFKENNPNTYKTSKKTYSTGSFSKNIVIKNKDEFVNKIGFLQDRKNKKAKIKTRERHKKFIKNFEFDLQQVKSIEKIRASKYVYDIEVEDNHRFFANNVLVHNTDSIAFLQSGKSKKEIDELLVGINRKLPGIMELDLEGYFKRGIWVSRRSVDVGAKKKYALIDYKDKIKIRGFETVRRDWCNLARETQNKVLEFVLKNGDEKKAVMYVKKVIARIKKRDVDLSKMIIRTQLKKPIEDYKSISPHVAIAKKMKEE